MTEIMGLPDEAPERFTEWSMDGSIMKRPCSPDVGAGRHPLQNLFTDELRARRSLDEMPADVFRTLAEATIEGEPLTEQEVVTQLHFMVQARESAPPVPYGAAFPRRSSTAHGR